MHRWLLLLMIALLPLRGWVGDAMAGQLLSQRMSTGATAVAHAGHDCAGHAQSSAQALAAVPADPPAGSSCADCQALSSAAVLPDGLPGSPSFQPPKPVSPEARFASVDRVPRFKPPIS
jgi:hypothetical protein